MRAKCDEISFIVFTSTSSISLLSTNCQLPELVKYLKPTSEIQPGGGLLSFARSDQVGFRYSMLYAQHQMVELDHYVSVCVRTYNRLSRSALQVKMLTIPP